MSERVVTLNGGSKAYGLANIRIGWGCGPADIIQRMNYYTMATSITVPHVAKVMAHAALEAPRAYLDGNIRECMSRAALVEDLVEHVNDQVNEALGFVPDTQFFRIAHRPKAAHSTLVSGQGLQGLSLPDGGMCIDSIDVTRYFLGAGKVCFSPALSNGFDDCTVRVSFGCLGWEHTYAETRRAETRAAVHALLTALPVATDEAEVLRRMRKAGIDPSWDCADDTNEGFALGREMIRDAFVNRIAPAAARLALHNRELLAAGAGGALEGVGAR
jgi:aspartate aminotransferase